MSRLAGKVAVVTGGASGIGAASCRAFVREGAKVVIGDIDYDLARHLADSLGPEASAQRFDGLDVDSIGELIAAAVERHGGLDVLHNNVGGSLDGDTTAVDIPFEVWNRTMALNATATLAGCKFAIPHMLAGGGGSIINTASMAGLQGSLTRLAYGSSKAALIAMTRYVATQFSRQGVRCNAIAPGPIVTPALMSALSEFERETMARHLLTPSLGTPEDVGALASFLASDESRFITGQVIACDGGLGVSNSFTADLRGRPERS
jgi:NAD(P)-dependent dehydrogenase (short-subunit alcohol dehydrogenase family)